MHENISLGKHYLVEYVGCDEAEISQVAPVKKALLEAVERSGATYVKDSFHQFNPYGVSGIVLIAESHFSIHTWPEHHAAALDVFTCGETMNAESAIDFLGKQFGAAELHKKVMDRGTARTMVAEEERYMSSFFG